jgi:hypothetical protein
MLLLGQSLDGPSSRGCDFFRRCVGKGSMTLLATFHEKDALAERSHRPILPIGVC